MKCPQCGQVNQAQQKFCGECGTKLPVQAEAAESFAARNYTPPHLAQKILQLRSAVEGERKPVTVLFCDIANSTGLAERLGAERMHQLLSAFFEAALGEVHRFEGTVNQFLGDGFMALFGAPLAHEDHSRRAVLAALAIRRAVAVLGAAHPLRLRMGLNSGAVVVGSIGDNLRMDYTAIGDTTNVAARIQAAAEPDTILLSEAVQRAVQAHVQCRPLGPRQLKGKSEAVVLFEATQLRPGVAQADAGDALVGRQREQAQISEALEQLRAGHGGVLAILGDAGLGKSRLLQEARALARQQGLRWLQGDCVSFGKTLSYWSFREVLRHGFGIVEGDDEAQSWYKVDAGMRDLFDEQANELLPYIGSLMALSLPEALAQRVAALDSLAMGHQIFRCALLTIERAAQQQPLVVAFEDWHWADASSSALLEHLLPLSDRVPLLFVIASRPESQGPAHSLRQALAPEANAPPANAQMLLLQPLPSIDSKQLAERLLGGGRIPAEVREMLDRRAQGNPFYLGELVRTLLDTQAIVREGEEWRATERFRSVPLPATIEGLILARIDRLDEEAKQVLKAAAVVGRTFFYRVLKAITDASVALDQDIGTLRKAELVDEKQRNPELEYVFKHPLIQQATYDSLLEDRRRQVHRQVGQCIEQLFAGRLEPFYSVLAYHYAKADDPQKARDYLLKAADHADRLSADEEALELYNAVIADAERSPLRGLSNFERAELEAKIGDAHFRAGRLQTAKTTFVASLARLGVAYPKSKRWLMFVGVLGLLTQLPRRFREPSSNGNHLPVDAVELLKIHIWDRMAWIDFFVDQVAYLYDAVQLANTSKNWPPSARQATGLSFVGLCLDAIPFYGAAERFHSRSCELASRDNDANALATSEYLFSLHLLHAGRWNEALAHGESALALASRTGNTRVWAGASANCCIFEICMGESKWLMRADEMLEKAQETNDDQAIGWATSVSIEAALHRGNYDQALRMSAGALRYFQAIPDYMSLALINGYQARAYLRTGNLAAAASHADEVEDLIRSHRLGMTWVTWPMVTTAEVRLAILEASPSNSNHQPFREALFAVKSVEAQSHKVRDESPAEAYRLNGTLKWLTGNQTQALALWAKGIEVARAVGARNALAKIYFERGLRGGCEPDFAAAEQLFEVTGNQGYLQVLRSARLAFAPS